MVETSAKEDPKNQDDQQEKADPDEGYSAADDPKREELLKEHLSESSKCAECGEPVDNLRKTCPNCGHEYEEGERDDDEAGNEFKAGAALDDDGNEITDEAAFEDDDDEAGDEDDADKDAAKD